MILCHEFIRIRRGVEDSAIGACGSGGRSCDMCSGASVSGYGSHLWIVLLLSVRLFVDLFILIFF